MPIDPTIAHHRGRVAALTRTNDKKGLAAARRDLDRARLEAHIRRLVDAAPPITIEQRDRITAIVHAHPNTAQ
ncbi:MAG: hypothetical protein PGN29_02075 [Gordonia paraffinivorans]